MATEKRVNIALSEDVHTQAKLISIVKQTTLNDYLKQIIEQAIKKDKDAVAKTMQMLTKK